VISILSFFFFHPAGEPEIFIGPPQADY